MKRASHQLESRKFDVLVIGGGIYGAWTAYDAALRGLSVAIIDKGDWASGTSSASTKLVHGGLRYLEQLRFGLVRRALKERELLLELAPHAVKPLRFVIPDYPDNRVAKWKLRAGLRLYDVLAGGGTGSGTIARDEMAEQHAFLAQRDLRGGLVYYDCQMDDARLVIEIISGAAATGAIAANYVEAVGLLAARGGVRGACVRDRLDGREFEIKARTVVNTAGPWAGRFGGPPLRLIKGVHLVMPALPTNDAFLFMTRGDRRVIFLVPWYGRTLLGTTDTDFDGNADDVEVTAADIDYLLSEAGRYLGAETWSEADILGRFGGVRALQSDEDASGGPASVTREWRLAEPKPGLFVSLGGKYTSARADAARLVDRVMTALKRYRTTSPTATRAFPWCPSGPYDAWYAATIERSQQLGLSEHVAQQLCSRHGIRTTRLHDGIANNPDLGRLVTPDLPFVRAELIRAVREEMAVTLEDVVRRRVPIAILTEMTEAELRSIAEAIAPHLPVSRTEIDAQIASVLTRWSRSVHA